MLEVILIALATLAIVLYLQARQAAREIRQNRERSTHEAIVFYRSDR
ncbi:hypothetical protein PXK00_12565 [Phaeobacter sp. QD34_3]|nr:MULTISPECIES: hypothetical protein [unclassified Phaeobacter]MDE4133948.1 hypothetical protein [Phaeobacter sp. QD34_3]MDE4137595.1 hypothetical protein [Phaeobacter sp. QD34_24]MDE4175607.1 hypothetical protein [Phaeobacter sp. PT47_59]